MKDPDIFMRFDLWLTKKMHKPLDDKITTELEATTQEIINCDYTIKQHEFQRFMAIRKQKALVDWVQQEKPA